MRKRRIFIIASCLILCLGYLVYGLSVSDVFILDDFHVVKNNPTIADISNIPTYLQNFFNRSIFYSSLALNYYFCGSSPTGFQWGNIVLHLSNTLLLAYFLIFCAHPRRSLGSSMFPAFVGSVIFLIHPIQSIVIHQVANRAIMLCAFFYLLGLVFFVRFLREKRSLPRIVFLLFVLFAFLLALASKSIAVSFPVACLLFFYVHKEKNEPISWGIFVSVLLVVVVASLILIMNSQIIQETTMRGYTYFLTQLIVLVRYLVLIVVPFNIVPEYIVPLRGSIDFLVFLSACFHLLVIVLALKVVKKKSAFGVGVLLVYLSILPSSSCMPRDNIMLIYRLYLPFIGVALVTSAIVDSVLSKESRVRISALVLIILYLLVCLFQCAYQNVLLSDNLVMWKTIQSRFPQSHIPDYNIGSVYLKRGEVDQAIFYLSDSLKKESTDPKVLFNLATAFQLKGRIKDSLIYFKKAYAINPQEERYCIGLGNAYYLDNQYSQALDLYKQYVASYPFAADIFCNMYYCYSAIGNDQAALVAISHAVTLDEKRLFLMNKAICLSRLGRYDEASVVFVRIQSAYGQAPDVLFQEGVIAQKRNNAVRALELYHEVLVRDSDHIGALNNSGVLFYEKGEYSKAREKWDKVLSLSPHDKVAILNTRRLKKENRDR